MALKAGSAKPAVTLTTTQSEGSHKAVCAAGEGRRVDAAEVAGSPGKTMKEPKVHIDMEAKSTVTFSTAELCLMARWRWALLIFELLLIALILVLPQVDLPDYTFHGGTAPIAAKARVSSAPSSSSVGIASLGVFLPSRTLELTQEKGRAVGSSGSDVRLALLCTFLC